MGQPEQHFLPRVADTWTGRHALTKRCRVDTLTQTRPPGYAEAFRCGACAPTELRSRRHSEASPDWLSILVPRNAKSRKHAHLRVSSAGRIEGVLTTVQRGLNKGRTAQEKGQPTLEDGSSEMSPTWRLRNSSASVLNASGCSIIGACPHASMKWSSARGRCSRNLSATSGGVI